MATQPECRVDTLGESRDGSDGVVTFFMQVFKNYELANICLKRLRQHFPEARVVVRSDGDEDPRYEHLVGYYGIEYRCEPRLFTCEHGGAAIARMLEIFIERPAGYLFKVDPDTEIHRKFRYLPKRDGLFGTVQGNREIVSIQGGCIGLTRNAVRRIIDSALLNDRRLVALESHGDNSGYWQILANRARRTGLSSFDWTLGWAASQLDVPVFAFPEVCCNWQEPVDNPDLQYAVTHPVRSEPHAS